MYSKILGISQTVVKSQITNNFIYILIKKYILLKFNKFSIQIVGTSTYIQ